MQKMMEYEIRMDEIRQKNMEKEQKQREKQMRFEMEVEEKRKQVSPIHFFLSDPCAKADEKRIKQEQEKYKKAQQQEQKNKQLMTEQYRQVLQTRLLLYIITSLGTRDNQE